MIEIVPWLCGISTRYRQGGTGFAIVIDKTGHDHVGGTAEWLFLDDRLGWQFGNDFWRTGTDNDLLTLLARMYATR